MKVGAKNLRLYVAYRPQEYDPEKKKLEFWEYVTKDAKTAKDNGEGYLIEMDGNMWAG